MTKFILGFLLGCFTAAYALLAFLASSSTETSGGVTVQSTFDPTPAT